MAKQSQLFLHIRHNSLPVTFANADGTTAKSVFVATADDSDLKMVSICSNDTAAVNLQLFLRRSGVSYLLTTINVPTLSGTNGVAPPINAFALTNFPGLVLDAMLKPYLPMKAADELWAAPLVAITAAKTVTVLSLGHDY